MEKESSQKSISVACHKILRGSLHVKNGGNSFKINDNGYFPKYGNYDWLGNIFQSMRLIVLNDCIEEVKNNKNTS
jgi:hypothetical protein